MIKFILNGSFRSGTTVLWKLLKECNPDTYVFSEPLHNEFFVSIEREQVLGELGHGYSTTDEYVALGDTFLSQIRKYHPNIGRDVYTFQTDKIIKYFRLFDSLDKPAILQPNRLHFVLADVSKEYNCPVAHVIRHPMDVFLSVMFSSPTLKRIHKALEFRPYFLRRLKDTNPYFLDEQSIFIYKYFGKSVSYNSGLMSYLWSGRYYLSRFIVLWTITNWFAVKEIDKVNGMVTRYEDIVNKESELGKLAEFSGVNFNTDIVKLHKNSIKKYSDHDSALCYKFADRAGVGEEFRFLTERFGYE